jgi:quercetin dioxygenase-like cupin family protein
VTARHLVQRAAEAQFVEPAKYRQHAHGFRGWYVVTELNAVHSDFGLRELDPDGHVDWHVHSYEESFYIQEGEVVLQTDDGSFVLRPGDYGVISVGAPHAWRGSGAAVARWAEMSAPQPRADRDDTFFVASRDRGEAPIPVDARDPRTRSMGHLSPANMEVDKQSQEHLLQSASMRTALLVYSGITVKMMVDSDLGAELLTMFMVQYQPGGVAGAHDHPLEETYLIVEGVVDATFDGQTYRLEAGDIGWAGVGCVHGFSNPGPGIVRWLETQAPQPPGRHSYRFARDWTYLRSQLEQPHSHPHP